MNPMCLRSCDLIRFSYVKLWNPQQNNERECVLENRLNSFATATDEANAAADEANTALLAATAHYPLNRQEIIHRKGPNGLNLVILLPSGERGARLINKVLSVPGTGFLVVQDIPPHGPRRRPSALTDK